MADTDSDSTGIEASPRIDAKAFLVLQWTIRDLGRDYRMSGAMGIDESSSNLGLPDMCRFRA